MIFPFHSFQKDDPDDSPIELSKVQSVKAVAKKRRDRSLPRAFEIFTDSKTYVFKAKDEKNAEEWLQCINVALAQAKPRSNHISVAIRTPALMAMQDKHCQCQQRGTHHGAIGFH